MPSEDGDESQRLLASSQADHGTISSRETTTVETAKVWHETLTVSQLILMLTGPFMGGFLAAVDSTLVGTLGGAISSSLGDLRLLTWLGSSFFIATCVSQPVVGKITDIYGRRPVLLFATGVFCLGNILCALAQSEALLLTGRIIAGLGGGCIGPIVSFIMSDIIPLRQRGIWQGFGNICFGFGSGLGGPLGGWIVQISDWRWAFVIQIPITVLIILLVLLFLPETAPAIRKKYDDVISSSLRDTNISSNSHPSSDHETTDLTKLRRIDVLGSFSLTSFLVLLLLGLNTGGSILPWWDPLIIASLCASLIFLGVFVYIEHAVAVEPILDLRLFRIRTLTAAWLTNWFASMARFGFLFYGPLLFQVQGFSVSEAGSRFVPESVAIVVASISAGAVIRATGKHYWLGVGVVSIQIIGLLLICTFTTRPLRDSLVPTWTAFIFLFLQGFGYSGMLTTTLIAMIASAEQKWQAVITSTSYAFRSTGSVIGITIGSAVFENSLRLMILGSHLKSDSGGDGSGGSKEVDLDKLLTGVQRDLHFVDHLHEPLQSHVRGLYIAALRNAFYALLALALLALVSAAFIRPHKLHTSVSRRD